MKFYVAVLDSRKHVLELVARLVKGGISAELNPFENIIVSPMFIGAKLRRFYSAWRNGQLGLALSPKSAIMDSGGFQVQTGRVSFEVLCARLVRIWETDSWADYYVLPDHVPMSSDSDLEVERKVKDTLKAGERFLKFLPPNAEAIGVVHGRNMVQVMQCVRAWRLLGVRYLAFGSFGTSGPNGSINLISGRSLRLLRAISEEAASWDMKLHVFGIGYPSHLRLLAENGIKITSFDSSGWWKAAWYRQIFFDGAPQRFALTAKSRNPSKIILSAEDIESERRRTGHDCPFCREPDRLLDTLNLALHNLMVIIDCVLDVSYDNANR